MRRKPGACRALLITRLCLWIRIEGGFFGVPPKKYTEMLRKPPILGEP